VENPHQLSGSHVIGVNIARARHVARATGRQRYDEEIPIDASGIVGLQPPDVGEVAMQTDANVHAPLLAE
jgi:hypothetical protein